MLLLVELPLQLTLVVAPLFPARTRARASAPVALYCHLLCVAHGHGSSCPSYGLSIPINEQCSEGLEIGNGNNVGNGNNDALKYLLIYILFILITSTAWHLFAEELCGVDMKLLPF